MKESLAKLFVAANDSECERVKELLTRKGFEYSLVDVRKSGLTPFLSRDIGAERVPALVTRGGTVVGYKDIEKFAKALSNE